MAAAAESAAAGLSKAQVEHALLAKVGQGDIESSLAFAEELGVDHAVVVSACWTISLGATDVCQGACMRG
jgi:hypothetical protein